MIENDPKQELLRLRALVAARRTSEMEQVERYRALVDQSEARVHRLAANLVEIDAGIAAIDARRGRGGL